MSVRSKRLQPYVLNLYHTSFLLETEELFFFNLDIRPLRVKSESLKTKQNVFCSKHMEEPCKTP